MKETKHVIVKSISFSHHFVPNMSCGTGYYEPDFYKIFTTDGDIYNVSISMWYRPDDMFEREARFGFELLEQCSHVVVDNLDETIEMVRNEYKKLHPSANI